MQRGEQIRLQLPAQPEYGRVARIAAAQLALRLGFSLHDIDDLRLVMDEAATLLIGGEISDATITIDFTAGDDGIGIDARIDGETDDNGRTLPDDRIERFRTHAGELTDSFNIDATSHRLSLTKSKAAA